MKKFLSDRWPLWGLVAIALVMIFTIFLTENLQIADAEIEFIASGAHKTFELDVGETVMQLWNLSNMKEEDITLELYAVGEGSELFVFEKFVTIEPKKTKEVEIFVTVPDDHSDNVEYHTQLKVLKRAPQLEEGVTGIRINIQYTINAIIKIGDNPVFTAPEVEIIPVVPKEQVVKETPKVEEKTEETIEEKMARIQESNKQYESPIEVDPIIKDSEYEPEPTIDPEPIAKIPQQEKVECGFVEWFLSLFGFGKC